MDKFLTDEDISLKNLRAAVLSHKAEKEMSDWDKQYQYDFGYSKPQSAIECTNTADLVEFAREGKCEIDSRILVHGSNGSSYQRLGTKAFIESFDRNNKDPGRIEKFLESFDSFDFSGSGINTGFVGQDFISFLGGPFDKQLYISDYLKMHGTAFMTYNHDPIAHRGIHIKKDFTLGRGFRVDIDSPKHLAIWRAAEEANQLQELFTYLAIELSLYGEVMLWRLPDSQRYIQYQLKDGQEGPRVLLPRYRLIDPSTIWEIVTFPEDITRVLYYKWVAPTQYQMYTGSFDGKPVPTTKFIMQQIPADQIFHFKTNCVSNEKRGRSDLFSILGYLKRLRDAVNYSIISDQKNSAWAIDTSIEGAQSDIDNYISSMNQLGTIAPAGSEFVHTSKVVRQYLANQGRGNANSASFEWCFSMIASGLGIPQSYFGTHLNGGSTRASAMVGTEPSAKMFEERQLMYEQIVKTLVLDTFKQFGMDNFPDIEVTFPEIITQDRSAKLKDLSIAVQEKWISNKRAAQLAAKEFNIDEFDYELELKDIEKDPVVAPLTAEPGMNPQSQPETEHSDINSASRKKLSDNDGF